MQYSGSDSGNDDKGSGTQADPFETFRGALKHLDRVSSGDIGDLTVIVTGNNLMSSSNGGNDVYVPTDRGITSLSIESASGDCKLYVTNASTSLNLYANGIPITIGEKVYIDGTLYGGCNASDLVLKDGENIDITVKGKSAIIYGGCNSADMTSEGSSAINITVTETGDIGSVYGGGYNSNIGTKDRPISVTIDIEGVDFDNRVGKVTSPRVYGGGMLRDATGTFRQYGDIKIMTGEKSFAGGNGSDNLPIIYGGGQAEHPDTGDAVLEIVGNIDISIASADFSDTERSSCIGAIYGGGYATTNVPPNNCTATSRVVGDVHLGINRYADHIYGGPYAYKKRHIGEISGDITIDLYKITSGTEYVSDVVGGGFIDGFGKINVNGSITVNLHDGAKVIHGEKLNGGVKISSGGGEANIAGNININIGDGCSMDDLDTWLIGCADITASSTSVVNIGGDVKVKAGDDFICSRFYGAYIDSTDGEVSIAKDLSFSAGDRMNVTYRFYGAGYVSGKLNAQNVGIKIGDNFISNGPIYCAGQVYGDGTTYTPSITIANNVETSIGDNLVGTWFYAGGSLTGSSTASKGTLSIGGDIRTTIGNGANLSSGEFIGAGSTSTAGGCAVAGNVTTTIDGISTYNFTAAGKATAANGKSIVGFDIDGNPSATGGNVSTTIKSCTIKSSYYGAGYTSAGSSNAAVHGSVSTTIESGTMSNYTGAGYVYNGKASSAEVHGNVTNTLKSATIANEYHGAGYAYGTSSNTEVKGTATSRFICSGDRSEIKGFLSFAGIAFSSNSNADTGGVSLEIYGSDFVPSSLQIYGYSGNAAASAQVKGPASLLLDNAVINSAFHFEPPNPPDVTAVLGKRTLTVKNTSGLANAYVCDNIYIEKSADMTFTETQYSPFTCFDLNVAEGAALHIKNNGLVTTDLSGNGKITLPNDKKLTVEGKVTGNLELAIEGTPIGGHIYAAASSASDGGFTYGGPGVLRRSLSGSQYLWQVADDGPVVVPEENRTDADHSGVLDIKENSLEDFLIYDAFTAMKDNGTLPVSFDENNLSSIKPIHADSMDIEVTEFAASGDIAEAIARYWDIEPASKDRVKLIALKNTSASGNAGSDSGIFVKFWRMLTETFKNNHGGEVTSGDYLPIEANFTISSADIPQELSANIDEGNLTESFLRNVPLFVVVSEDAGGNYLHARSLGDAAGGDTAKYAEVSKSGDCYLVSTRILLFDHPGGVSGDIGADKKSGVKWLTKMDIKNDGDNTVRDRNYYLVQDGANDGVYNLSLAFAVREVNSPAINITVSGDVAPADARWSISDASGDLAESGSGSHTYTPEKNGLYSVTFDVPENYKLKLNGAEGNVISRDLKWGERWDVEAIYNYDAKVRGNIVLPDGASENLKITGPNDRVSLALSYDVTPPGTAVAKTEWKSSNNKMATVDENGMVTVLSGGEGGRGECTITLTLYPVSDSDVVSAEKTLTVTSAYVIKRGEVFTVDKNTDLYSLSVEEGGTLLVQDCILTVSDSLRLARGALISLYNGAMIDASTAESSGTPQLITQGNDKINIRVKQGSSLSFSNPLLNGNYVSGTISCGRDGSYDATVPNGIRVTPVSAEITEGETYPLSVEFSPSSAYGKVIWSSTSTDIAEVAADGTVTAVTSGRSVIEASITTGAGDTYTSSCDVTVVKKAGGKADNIVFLNAGDPPSLELGTETTAEGLTPSVLPSSANVSLSWRSDREDIAAVDAADGTLTTFLLEGSCEITVTDSVSAKSASYTVIVRRPAVPVEKITFSKTGPFNLKLNETLRIEAAVEPENATVKSLSWSSSKPEVAEAASDGSVTAKGYGLAIITATANDASGVHASYIVEIKNPNEDPSKEDGKSGSGCNSGVYVGAALLLPFIIRIRKFFR
ncbi:Ig-like domain-containing protein [uncultured Cloacibacillus sp.]|uniref:Ig-like domain-containing protein n=1 Tax=uncultured Cloacibacillus sp. TaxID=889794 RepID=UPI002590576A|nr:Ig-like domain-containing protein [uncultured Cloacibacillus sp.]